MIPDGRPSGPFRAMYAGSCQICGEPFPVGALIVRRRDTYSHYACATEDNE